MVAPIALSMPPDPDDIPGLRKSWPLALGCAPGESRLCHSIQRHLAL